MNEDKRLKEKYGNRSPYKVPEGYFEEVFRTMAEKLPEQEPVSRTIELSRWQRLKPYVYLAAMFAGIWCMMKVFTDVSKSVSLSVDNPPAHIAQIMATDSDAQLQMGLMPMSDMMQEEDVVEHYSDIEALEKDFGFELTDEYRELDVDKIIEEDNKLKK